ncbi:Formyltransferase [Lojkania enalia]|uniref:methionyl-tRNA formyltransferase n=1 Tax=Lojkania enalia TaxID=147567 RepID=A0A9P4K478_9PLEO|nr:Formyltransferase [Didymosphaeria enalia]
MLWRPSAPVRSFRSLNYRRCNSTKASEPLKILFCGSDEFSIASLRALNNAKHQDPKLIQSIDVVHRPGKPTGRGLKVIREVPIKQIATKELNLNTHEIDTFTGWIPPVSINMIIAVSFGLFVPPRILGSAKYGGVNVHPSLLPDFWGPAPIQHTLLKKRPMTGVTVQTLDPVHFDHGTILAQTPSPGLPLDTGLDLTTAKLTALLGEAGAQMLLHVLESRAFLPPLVDAGWYSASGGPIDHAEKITKQHRFVDLLTATADDILIRHRVLGGLWCYLPNGERIILDEIVPSKPDGSIPHEPATLIDEDGQLILQTNTGGAVIITRCTVAGRKRGTGLMHVKHALQ